MIDPDNYRFYPFDADNIPPPEHTPGVSFLKTLSELHNDLLKKIPHAAVDCVVTTDKGMEHLCRIAAKPETIKQIPTPFWTGLPIYTKRTVFEAQQLYDRLLDEGRRPIFLF